MKNPTYNRSDLSCAGTILACKSQVCRITGKALYNESFIQWAKEVMSFFAKAAWSVVKGTGSTLKEAYVFIFDRIALFARPLGIYIVPEGMSGNALRRKAAKAVNRNGYLILQA